MQVSRSFYSVYELAGQKDAVGNGVCAPGQVSHSRTEVVSDWSIPLCGKLHLRCFPALRVTLEDRLSTKPAPETSYIVLWSGEDPALHEALLEELGASGIPYADKPIGEEENAPDPLPIDWKPRFGFEVAVHHSDFPAAKQILEKLLSEGELADVELPAEDETPENDAANVQEQPNATTEEEPTVSVWAGSDPRTIEFLTAAMRENEIPIRTINDGELTVIYVPPSNAPRAREIVREITEGIPPQ